MRTLVKQKYYKIPLHIYYRLIFLENRRMPKLARGCERLAFLQADLARAAKEKEFRGKA